MERWRVREGAREKERWVRTSRVKRMGKAGGKKNEGGEEAGGDRERDSTCTCVHAQNRQRKESNSQLASVTWCDPFFLLLLRTNIIQLSLHVCEKRA